MALQDPATNFPLGGISTISPFALATALLVVSLLGWSVGLTPSPEYVYFRAFSRQGCPCRLPNITTAPHWDLRRRDFHPQVQQLASLRSPFAAASVTLLLHCQGGSKTDRRFGSLSDRRAQTAWA